MTMEDLYKLLLSVILGGIVGLEREYHEKPAGFRTNLLICMGSTLFTMISLYVGHAFNQDPGRIAAQIISGVGFLGAGAILREGIKVTGLTTAATIWLMSAVGMAIGYGYYSISIGAAGITLLVQIFFTKFEHMLIQIHKRETLRIKCEADFEVVERVYSQIEANGLKILRRKLNKTEGRFLMEVLVVGARNSFGETMQNLLVLEGVSDIEN